MIQHNLSLGWTFDDCRQRKIVVWAQQDQDRPEVTSRSLRFQLVILFSVPVAQVKVRATMYIATSLQLRVTLKHWDGPGDDASARSGMLFFLMFLDSTRLGKYRPFLPLLISEGLGTMLEKWSNLFAIKRSCWIVVRAEPLALYFEWTFCTNRKPHPLINAKNAESAVVSP